MERTIWHVDIELDDTGEQVTATARLRTDTSECCSPGIGLGTVHHDVLDRDLSPEFALAARRSLEDLGNALDYIGEVGRYSALDQA